MSPFWATMLDELRGRGRNGTLFLGVVLLLVFSALGAAALSKSRQDYILPVFLCLSALLLAVIGRAFWRAFTRKHERGSVGYLSCDELSKARSKLMNNQRRRSS
jgi:O-antigen/teichoic acid export membrane protein